MAFKNGDLVRYFQYDSEDPGDYDGKYINGLVDVVDGENVRIITDDGEAIIKNCSDVHSRYRYMNVYRVDRCYGGPEEGGWYYDTGEPIASIPFENEHEGKRLRLELTTKFKPMGDPRTRFSVIGGSDYEVFSEDHFAKAYPEERPHYE